MRPQGNGIILTNRNEFVVVGQAFNPETAARMEDNAAITASLGNLETNQEDDGWMIPEERYMDYTVALGGVSAMYEKLKAGHDRGNWLESGSPEYRRLSVLGRAADELLNGIFTELGIPQVYRASDD